MLFLYGLRCCFFKSKKNNEKIFYLCDKEQSTMPVEIVINPTACLADSLSSQRKCPVITVITSVNAFTTGTAIEIGYRVKT